jgi:hypothetical protein
MPTCYQLSGWDLAGVMGLKNFIILWKKGTQNGLYSFCYKILK